VLILFVCADIALRANKAQNKSVTFNTNECPSSSNHALQNSVKVDSETPQIIIEGSNKVPLTKTEFNFNDLKLNRDVKIAIADSTSFNDTFEDSRASSVASIHQITEALRRRSLMSEPRRAIEHLLSVGLCRLSFVASILHEFSMLISLAKF